MSGWVHFLLYCPIEQLRSEHLGTHNLKPFTRFQRHDYSTPRCGKWRTCFHFTDDMGAPSRSITFCASTRHCPAPVLTVSHTHFTLLAAELMQQSEPNVTVRSNEVIRTKRSDSENELNEVSRKVDSEVGIGSRFRVKSRFTTPHPDESTGQGFNALSSLEYILHCPNNWGELLFSILVMVRRGATRSPSRPRPAESRLQRPYPSSWLRATRPLHCEQSLWTALKGSRT